MSELFLYKNNLINKLILLFYYSSYIIELTNFKGYLSNNIDEKV